MKMGTNMVVIIFQMDRKLCNDVCVMRVVVDLSKGLCDFNATTDMC